MTAERGATKRPAAASKPAEHGGGWGEDCVMNAHGAGVGAVGAEALPARAGTSSQDARGCRQAVASPVMLAWDIYTWAISTCLASKHGSYLFDIWGRRVRPRCANRGCRAGCNSACCYGEFVRRF